MSLLAPVGDARYAQLRPKLKLTPSGNSADVFAEDSRLHWHPSAAPLRDLHIAGKVSVMPAIGYGDPNQSHFTSRHYWEVGEVNPFGRIGWLGRYLDKHGAADNPLQGLSLDWTRWRRRWPPSNVPVAAVSNPEYFSLDARDVWDSGMRTKLVDALRVQGTLATDDAELRSARNAARQTVGLRGQLAGLQGTDAPWQTAVPYPSEDGFARRLAVLAEMLDMGLPLKVVALDANGGYDTHDNQAGTLPNDLALFSQSLAAFQADLEARGLADRVLVNVWSEFGRRPNENGSGTDHGAAGLSMVIGTQAKGTMVGEFPGLAQLDEDDNLRHTTDFRAVYCSLLEQWLGVDAAGIIPNASSFQRPALVAVMRRLALVALLVAALVPAAADPGFARPDGPVAQSAMKKVEGQEEVLQEVQDSAPRGAAASSASAGPPPASARPPRPRARPRPSGGTTRTRYGRPRPRPRRRRRPRARGARPAAVQPAGAAGDLGRVLPHPLEGRGPLRQRPRGVQQRLRRGSARPPPDPKRRGESYSFGELQSGEVEAKTLNLKAGTWQLLCALPEHASAG